MASMSLGIGLTHIRRYDFVQPGFFYSGLYSVTTGLERLKKLIVIYNYRMLHNDAFPNNKQLKQYGHNLLELFNCAIEVDKRCGFDNGADVLATDDLHKTIMTFSSEFATQARYYNLDLLTGSRQQGEEPLKRWAENVNAVIEGRHYKKTKKKSEAIDQVSIATEDHTFVMITDERGRSITSLKQFYTDGDKVTVRQKYSMLYIYNITRFIYL